MKTEKKTVNLQKYSSVKITKEQRQTLRKLAALLNATQTDLVGDYIRHLAKKHRYKLEMFK